MSRILLTGASGFIGRACVAPLQARGFEVFTISSLRRPLPGGVVGLAGDLLDTAQLPGLLRQIAPTHLLHAAWNVAPGAYWTAPENHAWRAATAILLREFLEAGGLRAVGVGSCAEYRWATDIYRDDDPANLAPVSLYGQAKLAACGDFAAAAEQGASTAWARLFFPYGPGEAPARLLPSVLTALLRGLPVEVSAGTQLRDFMFVDDIGEALASLVAAPLTGPVNVASGRGIALRDLIAEAIGQLGGGDLVRFGAIPIREGDPPSIVADTTRLNRELGFRKRFSLPEGIARCIGYWRGRVSAGRQP
jgi:nucleoside-diphosphate-sugar epimerase